MSSEIDQTAEKLNRDSQQGSPKKTLSPEDLALSAAYLAENIKGEQTQIIDVRGQCSYADFFVVTSAPSERQTQAIARNINDTMRKVGITATLEGLKDGAWVLIDYSDVIVHCFLDSAREYYDIEEFWSEAKRMPLDEKRAIAALATLGLNEHGNPA